MKRGLKAINTLTHDMQSQVALTAPMKRGLKASKEEGKRIWLPSCTHCPDEKGTESYTLNYFGKRAGLVALTAPMKRGLKDVFQDLHG